MWSSVFKENECAVVPGPKISVVVDVKMCVVSQLLFCLDFFFVLFLRVDCFGFDNFLNSNSGLFLLKCFSQMTHPNQSRTQSMTYHLQMH